MVERLTKNTSASNQKETTSQVTTASASKNEAGKKRGRSLEASSVSDAKTTQSRTKEDKQNHKEAYAKFVGTWEDYAGTTATVTADGIVTIKVQMEPLNTRWGKSRGKRRLLLNRYSSCRWWGKGRLIFTPAGVQNEVTGTDGSQDVLSIGQSCKRQR